MLNRRRYFHPASVYPAILPTFQSLNVHLTKQHLLITVANLSLKYSELCVCLHACVNGLPLAEIHRPLQGLNHLGPVSSASLLPLPPSWRSPYESVHSCGPAPSATPAHGRTRLGMACPQSDRDTESLQWPTTITFPMDSDYTDKDTTEHALLTTDLDLWKELSEAASWVDLKRLSQIQDKLHDDGLVGHLLHQCMFLRINGEFTKLYME